MANGAASTCRTTSAAALRAEKDGITGGTDRTRDPVDSCDANGCRVANRQDACSMAVIAAAETWAFGRERRAASSEDDATGTTCKTASLYID